MNRISKHFGGLAKTQDDAPQELHTFFLACEYKPGGDFWNIIEPFAYDIKPAYAYGTLGVVSYNPECYGIVEVGKDCEPMMGYVMTITNPDTVRLLDRAKFFLGEGAFNVHVRNIVQAYTAPSKPVDTWVYMLSHHILNAYRQMQTVEFGIWDENDTKQATLLSKVLNA